MPVRHQEVEEEKLIPSLKLIRMFPRSKVVTSGPATPRSQGIEGIRTLLAGGTA
jgi:hypothetical protein